MSQSVSLNIAIAVAMGVSSGISTAKADAAFSAVMQLLDGTGAGKASKAFFGSRTIAASATDALDLAGVLVDALGASLTFTKIKMIAVKAAAANTGNITLGGGTNACNTFFGADTDKIVIKPDGVFVIAASDANGYAVTAGTDDLINIVNLVAAQVAYDIVIIGE
jgi:hypothetical protein